MRTYFIILVALSVALTSLGFGSQVRSKVSRVHADMRNLATGIIAYTVDNNSPPIPHKNFHVPNTLTTPIAYLSSIPEDPGKPIKSYVYFTGSLLVPLGMVLLICGLLLVAIVLFAMILQDQSPDKWSLHGEGVNFTFINLLFIVTIVGAMIIMIGFQIPPFNYVEKNTVKYTAWKTNYYGYQYHAKDKVSWVLQALGPDGDLDFGDLKKLPLERGGMNKLNKDGLTMVNFIYDPTNGTVSDGDIFRFHYGMPDW